MTSDNSKDLHKKPTEQVSMVAFTDPSSTILVLLLVTPQHESGESTLNLIWDRKVSKIHGILMVELLHLLILRPKTLDEVHGAILRVLLQHLERA